MLRGGSPQGFRTPDEVQRFGDMMDEMCYIVATKHGGSLKVRVYLCCRGLICFRSCCRLNSSDI